MANYKVIGERPKIVEFEDEKEVFGEVEEITSRELGAEKANIVKVTLWGPDFLHKHKIAEETYVCLKGDGEIFLDGETFDFSEGERVIIPPGTLHATRPKRFFGKLVFLCISSPPFDPKDVYNDPRGRDW